MRGLAGGYVQLFGNIQCLWFRVGPCFFFWLNIDRPVGIIIQYIDLLNLFFIVIVLNNNKITSENPTIKVQ